MTVDVKLDSNIQIQQDLSIYLRNYNYVLTPYIYGWTSESPPAGH